MMKVKLDSNESATLDFIEELKNNPLLEEKILPYLMPMTMHYI